MEDLTRRALIKEIIEDVKNDLEDEEIIRLILVKKIAMKENYEKYTLGQKAADRMAKIAGSWLFISIFVIILIVWITLNNSMKQNAFDPFPFILLNLALSCLAAVQAPLILMSQNRKENIDRQRAENDYKVNLKTEIIIQELYDKLDLILESQAKTLSTDDEV